MQVQYERCAGIDVHKSMIVVCLLVGKVKNIRKFGTFTDELREMTHWLKDAGCQMVAMESSGVYWKPLYNIFELEGLSAMVVNAQHMKAVPGRKTDILDAQWIADLLQHGLLKPSFIPDREHRELRDLVRYRKSRIEERAREINRLQKMLEGANIKLSGVVSDITGKSAMELLNLAIDEGELNVEAVKRHQHGKMKSDADMILRALRGAVSPGQRLLLREIVNTINTQTKQIQRLHEMVQEQMPAVYKEAAARLEELPGVGRTSAEQIVAELGTNMDQFPSPQQACSWVGVCPGNNESAGKRKSGRTRPGNRMLKSTLVQCAKAAVKKKDSFFYAQYQRLCVRRGRNRATMAVAHSLLIAVWHVLKGEKFKDLGAEYYNQFNRERKIRSHITALERLGCPVTPAIAA
jgi:transposase